jgi:hypothetical protein
LEQELGAGGLGLSLISFITLIKAVDPSESRFPNLSDGEIGYFFKIKNSYKHPNNGQ